MAGLAKPPQGTLEQDAPASMAHVKRIIRRKLKKAPEHIHQEINIYPMIDMMTILLVVLLMQFLNSTAAKITESPELSLPYTTSTTPVDNHKSITITKKEILAPDKDLIQETVVTLNSNFQVDAKDKQGGSNGFLIQPLYSRMKQHLMRDKKIEQITNGREPFKGEVQIIADKDIPFRTVSEVIYTLGQTEYSRIRFVLKESR